MSLGTGDAFEGVRGENTLADYGGLGRGIFDGFYGGGEIHWAAYHVLYLGEAGAVTRRQTWS